jgi:hypothetical protein
VNRTRPFVAMIGGTPGKLLAAVVKNTLEPVATTVDTLLEVVVALGPLALKVSDLPVSSLVSVAVPRPVIFPPPRSCWKRTASTSTRNPHRSQRRRVVLLELPGRCDRESPGKEGPRLRQLQLDIALQGTGAAVLQGPCGGGVEAEELVE